MKKLARLEKSRTFWYLLSITLVFFLLRLPSLIEPNWYGDEGIYQVISLAMTSGRDLYAEIWDNKPPLLYVTYALFSGDQFSVRLLSLFLGISATAIFFFLSRMVFNNDKAASAAAVLFTFLFATPYLEGNIANAENFMLFFVITAALLIYRHTAHDQKQSLLFLAGILLGVAFLYKIVALFDFAAFCLFLIMTTLPDQSLYKRQTLLKKTLLFFNHAIRTISVLLYGFLLPIILTFIYFTLRGTLVPFVQSAFFGNIGYVGYGNYFIIPQGFLILKLLLFFTAITIICRYRKSFTRPVLFISLWFVFSVFSAFFSQRPYTHYLLVMLPTICLMAGLFFVKQSPTARLRAGLILVIVGYVALHYFHVYGIGKTFQYYHNAVSFLAGKKTVKEYQAFFDPETPRDYEVVSYIKTHTSQEDQVFVWGDSPQIYYLSQKLPPNKYTVSYHIIQDPNGITETQEAIDKIQPKFIITLSEAPPLPFKLPQYVGKYGIKGSAIYERTF